MSATDGGRLQANVAEIERALSLLHRQGRVFEVRALNGPKITAGFYENNKDNIRAAAEAVAKLTATGVYTPLNEITPHLLTLAENRLIAYPKKTTADVDVVRRLWFPVDVDPRRESDTSASDSEKAAAFAVAESCREFLAERGWAAPVVGDSGNGAHLLFTIDLPNDDSSRVLVERALKYLDFMFSDATAHVDTMFSMRGEYSSSMEQSRQRAPIRRTDHIASRASWKTRG